MLEKQKRDMLAEAAEAKHASAINAANFAYAYDMAVLAALGGSALEQFAHLGDATENSAVGQDAQGAPVPELPKIYTDVSDLDHRLMPDDFSLEGLKRTYDAAFPGVGHDLTFIDLGLNSVRSSHVTAFAADFKEHPTLHTLFSRIFVRFKGGALYRYLPANPSRMYDLVRTTRAMSMGNPTTLTVGEYIERVIKQSHEVGRAVCERFDPATNTWNVVLTKAQRQRVKDAASDDPQATEAVYREAQDFALRIHQELGDDQRAYETKPVEEVQTETHEPVPEVQSPDDPALTEGVTHTPAEGQLPESVPTTEPVPEPQVSSQDSTEGIGTSAVF